MVGKIRRLEVYEDIVGESDLCENSALSGR